MVKFNGMVRVDNAKDSDLVSAVYEYDRKSTGSDTGCEVYIKKIKNNDKESLLEIKKGLLSEDDFEDFLGVLYDLNEDRFYIEYEGDEDSGAVGEL